VIDAQIVNARELLMAELAEMCADYRGGHRVHERAAQLVYEETGNDDYAEFVLNHWTPELDRLTREISQPLLEALAARLRLCSGGDDRFQALVDCGGRLMADTFFIDHPDRATSRRAVSR
jgi:hypothetical protein